MKRILQPALAALALAACGEQGGVDGAAPSAESADLVIRNARIWTGEPEAPWASALAVRGDRIVAVGPDSAVEGW
ncbi:MAG TPA: amidohydrolase, partial [Xanthomonadales bacterium]|nr:amidohydrolase [Xanthomonadales bacterium]